MNIKGNLHQLHNPQLENTRQLHLFLIATTTAVTLQKYSIDLYIYNGKTNIQTTTLWLWLLMQIHFRYCW